MQNDASLRNHLLIAMPRLEDPNFSRTVTFLCEHNDEGAMGLVINRSMPDLVIGDILEQMQIPTAPEADLTVPVLSGGPVQPEHGFLLHRPHGHWDSSMVISDDLALTTSRDILEAIADGKGPTHYLVALGYAGWGPGQLEQELAENAWLSGPASETLLFNTPLEERWSAAAALLGIDLGLLSGEVGHA